MDISDEIHSRPPYKTRSASISAPGHSSMETIINPPSGGGGTPESGTPGYRRRRQATRSQSARITAPRNLSYHVVSDDNFEQNPSHEIQEEVRKKAMQQQAQQNLQDIKSHCTSEPRLNETETPQTHRRYGSTRRATQNSVVNNNNSVRKSNVYLDVPTMNMQHLQVSDPDIVRTFSSSNKGVVNRGDSFRRRRSRSNSLAPVSPMQAVEDLMVPSGPEETFKVLMLGGSEVGKAALLAQFKTSECINAYDEGGRDSPGLQNISIILNGIESELQFVKETLDSREELESADAFLVVYSVVDKPSFQKAEQIIMALTDMDLSRTRPIILVANKIDLARSRAISSQDGRCLACTHRTKFIEVSVGINHNVDELLAGTLTQIRLKKEQNALQASKDPSGHWYKNRNVVRASMKARQMVSWIFGKEDSKFRNCENLQVL
ncbi:GTP-binding protein REM 1 isoform X2 [Culicoides brevitarsis]|uniref:GTP-binding protein REM 1 isoform X2 n=1 Tax=Culicoides brevitarsis TaxID=469753 RepID=UPI00307BC1B4